MPSKTYYRNSSILLCYLLLIVTTYACCLLLYPNFWNCIAILYCCCHGRVIKLNFAAVITRCIAIVRKFVLEAIVVLLLLFSFSRPYEQLR